MNSLKTFRPRRKAKYVQVIAWIEPADLYEIDELIWAGNEKTRSGAIRKILTKHFKNQKNENHCITS